MKRKKNEKIKLQPELKCTLKNLANLDCSEVVPHLQNYF